MSATLGQGKTELDFNEIIATIRHSSLPTIVIEGKDDVIVYRKLEDLYEVSVLPVGGRETILKLFNNLSNQEKKKIIFVADKDAWCIKGVPNEYRDFNIVLTDGYSLENDIIRDGEFLGLMDTSERKRFQQDLEKFLKWYALAFSRFLAEQETAIELHHSEVFKKYDELTAIKDGENFPQDLFQILSEDPFKLVRGKSVLKLIVEHISYPGRYAKHHHRSLIEMVALRPGVNLKRLFEEIGLRLRGEIS